MIAGFLRSTRSRVRNVINKPFYSAGRLFFHLAGGKQRPVTFDIEATSPALRELDIHWEAIRDEVLALLPEKDKIPGYQELDKSQARIARPSATGASWKVFMLEVMGVKPEENRKKCPRTVELLDKIPNLYAAFFSILEPGKSIPAHNGPYCGYLRYHLGLVIPENNPPTMRVKDLYHTWSAGESLLFDDSFSHEVFNQSDGIRVVLIVDILRPMPFFAQFINRRITYQYLKEVYAEPMVQKAAQIAAHK